MLLSVVDPTQRAKTGIHGLGEVLGGGLPRDRLFLVQGEPGTCKTTLLDFSGVPRFYGRASASSEMG